VKRLLVFVLAPIVSFGAAQGIANDDNPGSLWPSRYTNPLLDRTARQEGDIVTILISEASAANFQASTVSSKSDKAEVAKIGIPFFEHLFPGLSTGGSAQSSGQGQTSQTGRFSARMSAVVKKVLPNGTLVIEGTRWIKVNHETQSFVLSGIVRRDDVRSDNTVLSEHLAEAEIRAEGSGAIIARQRRGVLSRILEWLF
jgi:flagellar L-ring protein FlgH